MMISSVLSQNPKISAPKFKFLERNFPAKTIPAFRRQQVVWPYQVNQKRVQLKCCVAKNEENEVRSSWNYSKAKEIALTALTWLGWAVRIMVTAAVFYCAYYGRYPLVDYAFTKDYGVPWPRYPIWAFLQVPYEKRAAAEKTASNVEAETMMDTDTDTEIEIEMEDESDR